MDDEKQNTESGEQKTKRILLTQDPFVTLMSVLQNNRLMEGNLCGGRGECGRCAVQFLDGAPVPAALERKRFAPEELRQGYRLACMAKPRTDCVVRLLRDEGPEIPVLTKTMFLSENFDLNGQEKNQSENQTSCDMESADAAGNTVRNGLKKAAVISERQSSVTESDENKYKNTYAISETGTDGRDYMIAVDLGTTTIAMQLFSMSDGKAVDTYCEHNPQRSYGADVLSRVQASCGGHREELQRLVCESLLRGLRRFVSYLEMRCVNIEHLRCICIAGNTTMEHLLMGYDVQSLGRSPFTPVEIGIQETKLADLFGCLLKNTFESGMIQAFGRDSAAEAASASKPQIWEKDTLRTLPVYLTPGISAFVGGDIVAGLYALRMLPGFSDSDTPAQRLRGGEACDSAAVTAESGVRFLIDLGTNGEMAVTDGKRMLVTATAAGPAFEGGGESALIGTDRIALAASFLQRGLLDETGLLAEPYFSAGVPVEAKRVRGYVKPEQETSCLMKQEDIRVLQMAKAAIRAGIEILWEELGRPRVDRLYLAGGFGYELDAEAAYTIGLLPVRLRGRVEVVGNTALAGAFLMGRALWEGGINRKAFEEYLTSGTMIESINLAKRKNFAALYLQYMNLEEN